MKLRKVKNNLLLIKLKDVLDYELKWDLTKGLNETIPYYEQAFKSFDNS